MKIREIRNWASIELQLKSIGLNKEQLIFVKEIWLQQENCILAHERFNIMDFDQ